MNSFETFRRELADVVTVAINSGIVVGAKPNFCPLGASNKSSDVRPGPSNASYIWGLKLEATEAFIAGFDGGDLYECLRPFENFYKLGRLYRERFVR